MRDDERMDQRIRQVARGLNEPPPTPRAEMWERIRTERATRRRPAVVPLRRPVRWVVWAVGLAATLALGIAIGRFSRQPVVTDPAAAEPEPGVESARGIPAAYQVATAEHLGRVETFLTVFRADAPAGREGNADFEMPARQLLRQTRLLRASPAAAEDVVLRALLDDVEFVLLQIAAYAALGNEQELDFVEQGITERSVMLRLRSAVPSGPDRRMAGGSL
jgi:hypothetical protein